MCSFSQRPRRAARGPQTWFSIRLRRSVRPRRAALPQQTRHIHCRLNAASPPGAKRGAGAPAGRAPARAAARAARQTRRPVSPRRLQACRAPAGRAARHSRTCKARGAGEGTLGRGGGGRGVAWAADGDRRDHSARVGWAWGGPLRGGRGGEGTEVASVGRAAGGAGVRRLPGDAGGGRRGAMPPGPRGGGGGGVAVRGGEAFWGMVTHKRRESPGGASLVDS